MPTKLSTRRAVPLAPDVVIGCQLRQNMINGLVTIRHPVNRYLVL